VVAASTKAKNNWGYGLLKGNPISGILNLFVISFVSLHFVYLLLIVSLLSIEGG